jgi:hypothetical protein
LPLDVELVAKPFTDNVEILKESYSQFKVFESAGDGEEDYSLTYEKPISSVGILSDAARASNRKRDAVNLVFDAPTVTVYRDGTTSFFAYISLHAEDREVVAFCNGIVFEVSGEAFAFPGEDACEESLYDQYNFDSVAFSFGDHFDNSATYGDEFVAENSKELRLFQLLAQNSFVVRLVDANAKEHVFSFDIAREFPSPQDLLRLAFEAEKAVKLGFGY